MRLTRAQNSSTQHNIEGYVLKKILRSGKKLLLKKQPNKSNLYEKD